MVLRQTNGFKAERSARGVRITTLERGAFPKSRVLPLKEWDGYLKGLSDESFNGACVFDFGVGVYR